jgi:hypothetical protein
VGHREQVLSRRHPPSAAMVMAILVLVFVVALVAVL